MNKILINIGNTHTSFADSAGRLIAKVETSKALNTAQGMNFSTAWCASVVRDVDVELQKAFDGRIHFLSSDDCRQIDFSEVDESTVGADRLANLLAADSLYRQLPVLIIDCGTCVTGELLAGSKFKGGFIMPGREIQRKSLNDYTSALPLANLSASIPSLIGKNTNDAILSGVDWMSLHGVQSAVSHLKKEFEGLKIIATGGDAQYFSVDDAEVIPDLTLRGLSVYCASFS